VQTTLNSSATFTGVGLHSGIPVTMITTIEHIMAALAGCGVRNALIEIDGPEVPIMDGAAGDFVRGFIAAGVVPQKAPLYVIEVLHPVSVEQDGAVACLSPAPSLEISFEIDFVDRQPDLLSQIRHRRDACQWLGLGRHL